MIFMLISAKLLRKEVIFVCKTILVKIDTSVLGHVFRKMTWHKMVNELMSNKILELTFYSNISIHFNITLFMLFNRKKSPEEGNMEIPRISAYSQYIWTLIELKSLNVFVVHNCWCLYICNGLIGEIHKSLFM